MTTVTVLVNTGSRFALAYPQGYTIKGGGCWDWIGAPSSDGYGRWYVGGKMQRAHRAVYERLTGPIPAGLPLDHLCRNPMCVNPAHLEPVTHRENILRGVGVTAQNARKNHCKNGHPFSKANTRQRRDCPAGRGRTCRACDNARISRRFR